MFEADVQKASDELRDNAEGSLELTARNVVRY